MSDRFRPTSVETLVDRIFDELEAADSILGIPRAAFFVPRTDHRFRVRENGVDLETPWGVAAGPHTQMAQNIVAAWLVGARVIELKTVQTLDELEVHKPCIDVTDEGYNVEWSQELRVHESFDEYLRAWVLVHVLHSLLGFPGERPGVLFDMSVGYDLAGVRSPKVAWYLDAMADASAYLPACVEAVARRFPGVRDVPIPARVSASVTLSTMHGCPPDEIERIALHLIEDRGLDTKVKCNPTLLGAETVRGIVNDDLGYADVTIPDAAFGHDLRWEDAVPMFRRLRAAASARGVGFGLKLSNTLEVENGRGVFDRDPTMYMSGRALHAVTVNLASRVAAELGPEVPLSFAGGVDCFNVARLLASGLRTVTACSDLLKTGGYLRMRQYADEVDAAFDAVGAADTPDLIRRTAKARGADAPDLPALARANLRAYADEVRRDPRYRKETYRTDRSKTARALGPFDCIAAPCVDECPVDQQVPAYMRAVRAGDPGEAARIARLDNPLPAVLGSVCDHLCERTCVRTHLDEPLAIRHVKRFVMEHGEAPASPAAPRPREGVPPRHRVAVVGAGPAGLAAAEWLARAGIGVTVLEAGEAPGGMVGCAIPAYRLPGERLAQDVAVLERLGVRIRYGVRLGADVTVDSLRAEGFAAVVVAAGAQRPKRLGIPGEDVPGVVDGLTFLRSVREGRPLRLAGPVAVVGAGDTAMDCARSARRVGAESVTLVYRRTIDQMPADREEVHALREEGIGIVELARPSGLIAADGRLAGLVCLRTAYGSDRDASGRKVPHDVPGSAFEIPAGSLIVAVGQDVDDGLFGADPPARTPAGWIATDATTLETSIPGVYAAGDAAGHGPASIVRAAADGKRAAAAIAASLGVRLPGGTDASPVGLDFAEVPALSVRRARRAYRVPFRTTPLDERGGFAETVLGYTVDEAKREAERCLDCDTMCSLCVGVCPNIALMTYADGARTRRPAGARRSGPGRPCRRGSVPFGCRPAASGRGVADLCNECGTASPPARRPAGRTWTSRGSSSTGPTSRPRPTTRSSSPAAARSRPGSAGATHRLARPALGAGAGAVGARPHGSSTPRPGFRAVLDDATLRLIEVAPTRRRRRATAAARAGRDHGDDARQPGAVGPAAAGGPGAGDTGGGAAAPGGGVGLDRGDGRDGPATTATTASRPTATAVRGRPGRPGRDGPAPRDQPDSPDITLRTTGRGRATDISPGGLQWRSVTWPEFHRPHPGGRRRIPRSPG